MPRGKYPRQNAAVKAAIHAQAAAPVVVPPVAAPSASAALVDEAKQIVQQAAAVAVQAISNARKPHRFADHAKSRDIDSLSGAALRDYAREIGMTKRDCGELGEDRLRAGCKSHLAHHIAQLLD